MRPARSALTISAFSLFAIVAVAAAQENVWTSHGPSGVGWVNSLAIGDASYAATFNGVFRSRDGGATWQQSGMAGEGTLQVAALPGLPVVFAIAASGFYASRDGGENWARITGLPPLNHLAIDPWHPSTVYAKANEAGLWRSTNGGATWQQISMPPVENNASIGFAFDSQAAYWLLYDNSNGLYKLFRSSDGGVNWAGVSSLPSQSTAIASGHAPGLVYAGGANRFCRSTDSATTWTCASFPAQYALDIVELASNGTGAGPRILVTSQSDLYVSSDGGTTWSHADVETGPIGTYLTFASDASGTLVLAGTDTMIYRSPDRGDTWTGASTGLQAPYIETLALDPRDSSTIWAVNTGNGSTQPKKFNALFRSTDGGLSWSQAGSEDLFETRTLVIDREHPSTLFAGGSSGFYRSEDGGVHWTRSAFSVDVLATDPGSPGRVWAGSFDGLFRSDDRARTWHPVDTAHAVYSLLFDARNPATMYAGSDYDSDHDADSDYCPCPHGGSLLVSRDGGTSFTKLEHDFGSAVTSIAVDTAGGTGLYVGTSKSVFRSVDDGKTWQPSSQGLPRDANVSSLVSDPVRAGRLYTSAHDHATFQDRVYRTIDGGSSWQPFSSGLGSLGAVPLVITPDGRWLHVGTSGGGVFDLDLGVSDPCPPNGTARCLKPPEPPCGEGIDSPGCRPRETRNLERPS